CASGSALSWGHARLNQSAEQSRGKVTPGAARRIGTHRRLNIMAHEIDITTGTAAVFVTGTPAWHRLGRVIAEAATSAEAIRLAGLDWEIEQWPLLACGPTTTEEPAGRYAPCPGTVANVRTDTGAVLGVVSRDYRVFQNREAFAFMDDLLA